MKEDRPKTAGRPRAEGARSGDASEAEELPAGGFSEWLGAMERALRGQGESEVPCDDCTACCASSQFVHIGPDEVETLARIPQALLFPVPRMPAGHVLLGYDGQGRCPMLTDQGCSIYEHRPRTCRTYDCRVFPAAGVGLEGEDSLIAQRARRWRFEHPTGRDRREHEAVRTAARFIQNAPAQNREDQFPEGGSRPANPAQVAILAIEGHGAFLGRARGSR